MNEVVKVGRHLKRNEFWAVQLREMFIAGHLYLTANEAKKGLAKSFGSPWTWDQIRDKTEYKVVRVKISHLE